MTLNKLYKIIENRKKIMPKESYVASLFRQGQDKIIQKIDEESIEVVNAARNESKERIISEVADLIFHLLVMLSSFNINPADILKELSKRSKVKKRL